MNKYDSQTKKTKKQFVVNKIGDLYTYSSFQKLENTVDKIYWDCKCSTATKKINNLREGIKS